MQQKIEHSIRINAEPSAVWEHLTNPDLIATWMAEPEMQLEIITDWKVGKPIIIKGIHYAKFENKGLVLQFDPERLLQYTHLSSLSHLPDVIESYTVITFTLLAIDNQTELTVRVENFPTESIFKHHEFYWKGTLGVISKGVEI